MTFDGGALEAPVPDGADVLAPRTIAPLADPAGALQAALAHPLGGPALRDRLTADDHVTVVVTEFQRPAVSRLLVAGVLEAVGAAGVPPERVTILLGGGLHPLKPDVRSLLGETVAGGYRVLVHDAQDRDRLIFLGRYPGAPRGGYYLHAAFQRASARIVTGVVEPHLFMGFSGGGAAVLPGVASAHNIRRNRPAERFLDPRCAIGIGAGNPVFDEMRAVAEAARITFACQATLTAEGAVSGWYGGDLAAAHDAAMAAVSAAAVTPVERAYDIVVAGAGGAPHDRTLHQALPALAGATRAVRDGGDVLLLAACGDGLGGAAYAELLAAAPTPETLLAHILAPLREPGPETPGLWSVLCQVRAQLRARTFLYSALPDAAVRRAHFTPAPDVAVTLAERMAHQQAALGRPPRVLLLPDGRRRFAVAPEA